MRFDRARGTNDYGPADMAKRRAVEDAFRRTAETFGFREVQVPSFEHLDLFTAKSGPGIVGELYAFKDKGGRDLALRPEFTAGIVRFYLQELRNLPKPVKVFALGNAFRYEEPQKGRYREFTQFNCEILGAPGIAGDAEVIAVASDAVRAAGVAQVEMRIGHIGALRSFLKAEPADQARVLHALDKRNFDMLKAELDRLSLSDLRRPLESYVGLKGGAGVLQKGASLLGGAGGKAFEELKQLGARLKAYGVTFTFDLGVVRGLDYYTGVVFEIDSPNLGAEKQVGGGGAYTLAELFGGEPVAQTGFAIGLDRVVLAAEAEGAAMPEPRLDAYVVPIGEGVRDRAFEVLADLRRAGLRADIDLVGRGPSKNLEHANALRARFAVLLGEKELKGGSVALRDMETGEQREESLETLAAAIRGKR